MNAFKRAVKFGSSKTVIAIDSRGDVTVCANPWISKLQEAELVLEVTRITKDGRTSCKIEVTKNRWGVQGEIKDMRMMP